MKKEIAISPQGEEKPSQIASKMIASYVNSSIMSDFSSVPSYVKLAVLQKFPKAWIKTRQIKGQNVEYIDHQTAKKCLNFVFNSQIDAEITAKQVIEYEQQTSKGKAKVFEAMVQVKFTCRNGGEPIVREIISTHKAFDNPSTARFDCYKGAISKAWTLLAYSFGIASNVNAKEGEVIEYEEPPAKAPAPSSAPAIKKSFDTSPADNAPLPSELPY